MTTIISPANASLNVATKAETYIFQDLCVIMYIVYNNSLFNHGRTTRKRNEAALYGNMSG